MLYLSHRDARAVFSLFPRAGFLEIDGINFTFIKCIILDNQYRTTKSWLTSKRETEVCPP